MTEQSTFQSALYALLVSGGYTVSQQPIELERGGTCLSFYEMAGVPTGYASNRPKRVVHTGRVDVWTEGAPFSGSQTRLLRDLLIAGGFRVRGWGPEDYEEDTNIYHLPMDIQWAEAMEE